MIYCVDDRHGTPCPQPCTTCYVERCDPKEQVEADTPVEAMRKAGWDEAYIASVSK